MPDIDWTPLTDRVLAELADAPQTYQPTNFWGPGLEKLLGHMRELGLETFKSWPSSKTWFNPLYGNGWTDWNLERLYEEALKLHPEAWRLYLVPALNGLTEARRDFDVAYACWNQDRWPFDLMRAGESRVGSPGQAYPALPTRKDFTFGRGYLNYLICMAALSQHVEAPPSSFLELGGGFGVLGEILLGGDESTRYVNLDIPPLVTVASFYLTELFGGDRITVYDEKIASTGPIAVPGSAVLPNYRIEDVDADFEVFVNSFSFQEMEPDVVEHYVAQVAAKGVKYVVSLNSRWGKPRAEKAGDWGALEPVTSDRIVEFFGEHGFRALRRYDAPYVRAQGQLVVLGR